ncbi:MAG TPA: hypothetical protein PKA05_11620 [Roseiflexaceae bacterium]|nr:hypothetical protein [Roseiflexaceae bacterium]HMP41021.1 hypothetical protein [Roseiflexaceae bacterium]
MNRNHALVWLSCLLLLLVAGCEQTSIADQERIRSFETLQASTPSVTPTPTSTSTSVPTNTSTPTIGPSPTPTSTPEPTVTPIPSPTPFPPTPTPDPALADFSLCDQQATLAGDDGTGRFSAGISTISTTVDIAFEQIDIGLEVAADTAPPHATARCIESRTIVPQVGRAPLSSPYVLQIELDGWLHDDTFRSSVVSPTRELSGTTILRSIEISYDPNSEVGATLTLGLDQPLPFALALRENPLRLELRVATTSPIGPASDMLQIESQTAAAAPALPIFYLQDGDIWRFTDGAATNLTEALRADQYGGVNAMAVDQQHDLIAFCAAIPGADSGESQAPATLWAITTDGRDQRQLAAPGRACAAPVIAPDGATIAFSVDETGAVPPRLSIYTIATRDGASERRATPAGDEWSRSDPQWLDAQRLVYRATAEDGRVTIFLRDAAGNERDIGAELVRGDRYRTLGKPLVAPDGSAIAVEGLRADGSGADLLLLDADGQEIEGLSPVGGVYWARPFAWSADGALYYLTTRCASSVAQSYTLHVRTSSGSDRIVALGTSIGGFGDARMIGGGLAYVTSDDMPGTPRGPRAEHETRSVLWFWDLAAGTRIKLAQSGSLISGIAP